MQRLAAILVTLFATTVGHAEAFKPKQNNDQAQMEVKSPLLTARGRMLQTESPQSFAAHPAPIGTSKSLPPESLQFGFESSFGWQKNSLGQRVTGIQFGGLASRLELKPGDMIVGVNGQELRTATCWQNAIHRAADQDGWVTLKVLDGRSGRMAYRTANLFQMNDR